jgi:hypothetical protein
VNHSSVNAALAGSLLDLCMPTLPAQVVDVNGRPFDSSGDIWDFHDANKNNYFDFRRREILNPWLDYSLKRHLIYSIQRNAASTCYHRIYGNTLLMSKTTSWEILRTAGTLEAHAQALHKVMSEALELTRREERLHEFGRIRAWYLWCIDYLQEFGFEPDSAYVWQLIKIPGNEKGVAVRIADPECGPLNDAELILLRRALQRDNSMDSVHVQQRAAIWLALAYGRNPANFVQLRQGDFKPLIEGSEQSIWMLNIPRIKKRSRARTKFKEEYVGEPLADILKNLIKYGSSCPIQSAADRPLFIRSSPRRTASGSKNNEWEWHLTSSEFTALVQDAVERYEIVSPRTEEPLTVNTRRLRYTFATNRVREGISARDLAIALDHTDLQHVQVYFDAKSTVVERLDKAAAKEIAPKLALFKGNIVRNEAEAANGKLSEKRIRIIPELLGPDHHLNDLGSCGKNEFCHLFPPYSCYGCDRFQPFSDSLDVHEQVLDFLIERRERLRTDPLESSRIAVQLDEVIYACAQLVNDMQPQGAPDGSH